MKEFSIEAARINQIIRESILFDDITHLMSDSSDEHRIFVTCFLGVTISVASVDRKIYKSEIDEIIQALPKGLALSEKIKKMLVEVSLNKSLLQEGFSSELPHFLNYLNLIMKLPDKQKLIELFFKIGWSDKNLSGEENKLIVSLSKRLGFTEPEILRTRNHIQATYKAPKENEIADIKFDGKKSLKSISRKKYLNTLKNEQAIEAHKLLSENTLYYFLNKKYQKIEESDKFFLTAYLGLSFSFILTDDVIYEKEILYVKSHLKTWFELGDVHDELINMSSYLASNKNECFDSNNASLYAKVLAFFLDHEERIKFINSLFNLAYSDDEVHPNELKLIYEVAKVLELNGDLVANIKTESLGIEGSFKIIRADDPNLAK